MSVEFDPRAAQACAEATAALARELSAAREELLAGRFEERYDTINSARRLAHALNDITEGSDTSVSAVLQHHLEILAQVQHVFETISQRYADTDASMAQRLTDILDPAS